MHNHNEVFKRPILKFGQKYVKKFSDLDVWEGLGGLIYVRDAGISWVFTRMNMNGKCEISAQG